MLAEGIIMELKAMTFLVNEGDATPETITVKMTIQEALWVARTAGVQRGESPHVDIYGCLTSGVFNCYWEDGVDGAKKDHPVDIPPIRYED